MSNFNWFKLHFRGKWWNSRFSCAFSHVLSLDIFQWNILSIIQQCSNHLAKAVNSIDFHWFYHVWAENCVTFSYACILKAEISTIGTNEDFIKKKHAMESKQSRMKREKSVRQSYKFFFLFFLSQDDKHLANESTDIVSRAK